MADDETESSGDIPIGEWVEVPKGSIPAIGTYKDREGVLRSSYDHSCVTWHWVRQHGADRCQRKGIQPNEIVYDPDTGAPWCPECWPLRVEAYARKNVNQLFNGKN